LTGVQNEKKKKEERRATEKKTRNNREKRFDGEIRALEGNSAERHLFTVECCGASV
jgi:hypothetical protein